MDYITSSFLELNECNSDYEFTSCNHIRWKSPTYATFHNSKNIQVPKDYPTPELPPSLVPRRNNPNVCTFITNFTEARRTIEYWTKQAKPEDITQDTAELNKWICTCTTLLEENENVNNSWPIPAFFKWYYNDILTSSDKFLNLILQINNIPFAIGTNTVNSWFSKIREWSIDATTKFIFVQAPFPKCDVLHAFLYNANLWDPSGKDEYKECLTNKLRIIFSNFQESQNTNF